MHAVSRFLATWFAAILLLLGALSANAARANTFAGAIPQAQQIYVKNDGINLQWKVVYDIDFDLAFYAGNRNYGPTLNVYGLQGVPSGKSIEARIWLNDSPPSTPTTTPTTIVWNTDRQAQSIYTGGQATISGKEATGYISLSSLSGVGYSLPGDPSKLSFEYYLYCGDVGTCSGMLIPASKMLPLSSLDNNWKLVYDATPTSTPITTGALKPYADFNDGRLPTYSDWGKAWYPDTTVSSVANGQLVVTPKSGLSEGRLSFGNSASIIEYDFKIENVNATSAHFHIDLFNLAKMQETATLWPYASVVVRFPSLSSVPTPDIGFYVARWDTQQKKVASVFYDNSAGAIQIGKIYRARLSWIDNRIAFSLDGMELASYTFSQTYSQSLQPKADAYNVPGYISFDSNWGVAGSGNDFKWTIDNISTDVDFAATATTPPAQIKPTALTLTTPATLQSQGQAPLSASATYSDNTSKTVTPTWSSSDPTASIGPGGILYAGSVTADTPVTLTATYSENGVTVTASKVVTITAAPAALASVSIAGATTLQENARATFKASAQFSDGSQRPISPTWSVTPASLATITGRGVLSVGAVDADTPVTVAASYSEGGISKSVSQNVTVRNAINPLTNLSIIGAQGSLVGGAQLTLSAEALYSADYSRKSVSATWSVSNANAASITPSGSFTANKITTNTPVTVSASYSEGGVTKSADYVILVLAAPDTSAGYRIQTEVTTRGTLKNFGLSLVVKVDSAAARRFAAAGYQIFVAALLPTGSIVAVPTWFVLDRSSTWAPLTWPLKEFLANVQDASEVEIDILSEVDVTALSGSTIYVGWGSSADEMIAATRYKPVFMVP